MEPSPSSPKSGTENPTSKKNNINYRYVNSHFQLMLN